MRNEISRIAYTSYDTLIVRQCIQVYVNMRVSYGKINLCICGPSDILQLLRKRLNVTRCNMLQTTSIFHYESLI